jgi:hypothetical protein
VFVAVAVCVDSGVLVGEWELVGLGVFVGFGVRVGADPTAAMALPVPFSAAASPSGFGKAADPARSAMPRMVVKAFIARAGNLVAGCPVLWQTIPRHCL